ncbi:MAG: BatD family protein [Bacteroidota bacterium]
MHLYLWNMHSYIKNLFLFFIFLLATLSSNAQVSLDDPLLKVPRLTSNENPAELIAKNIFVQVLSSSKSVYTGEPVLVTYKLFTALNSQSRVTMQPSFSGCSVQELPIDKEPDEVILNGKKYHVFTIRKVQLIPLQAGELILGKAVVNNVVAISNSDDLMETENYSAVTGSEAQTLTVKALPENGKPPNFQILVGNYSIVATTKKDTLQVGESATLTIKILGSGNVAGISSPIIMWPENTEHFDGIDSQKADQYVFPVRGFKQFEIPFIGKKVGTTIIPPVHISYFDPATATYRNAQTDSIRLYFSKAVTTLETANTISNTSFNNYKYTLLIPLIGLIVFLSVFIPVWYRKRKSKNEISAPLKEIVIEKKMQKITTGELYIQLNNLAGIENNRDYFLAVKSLLVLALQARTGMEEPLESALARALENIPGEADNAKKSKAIFEICNLQLFAHNDLKEVREEVYFELSALLKNFDLGKAPVNS